MSIKKLISTIVLSAICCTSSLFAQTEEDVANAYNKGAQLVQSDLQGAISAFEEAISLADKVGDSAATVAENAKNALPSLYKQVADKLVSEQKLSEAAAAYEKTIEIAKKYGNAEIEAAAAKTLPQVNISLAAKSLSAKDYPAALAILNKITSADGSNLDALLLKGQALSASGSSEEAITVLEDLIAKATAANDQDNLTKAKRVATSALLSNAQALIKEKKNNDAIPVLEKVLSFDEANLNALQMLTTLYSAAKNNDKVIEVASKFISASSDAKNNANIAYYLGAAYQAKNNTAKACEAYKLAENSTNAQIATYIKQVLPTLCK